MRVEGREAAEVRAGLRLDAAGEDSLRVESLDEVVGVIIVGNRDAGVRNRGGGIYGVGAEQILRGAREGVAAAARASVSNGVRAPAIGCRGSIFAIVIIVSIGARHNRTVGIGRTRRSARRRGRGAADALNLAHSRCPKHLIAVEVQRRPLNERPLRLLRVLKRLSDAVGIAE